MKLNMEGTYREGGGSDGAIEHQDRRLQADSRVSALDGGRHKVCTTKWREGGAEEVSMRRVLGQTPYRV